MNILYRIIFQELRKIFGLQTLKFFDADLDQGSGILLTLNLGSGMKKFGSGINIILLPIIDWIWMIRVGEFHY